MDEKGEKYYRNCCETLTPQKVISYFTVQDLITKLLLKIKTGKKKHEREVDLSNYLAKLISTEIILNKKEAFSTSVTFFSFNENLIIVNCSYLNSAPALLFE